MSMSIKDILNLFSIKATKALSQNFILGKKITDSIAYKTDKSSLKDCFVVEIGNFIEKIHN